MSSVTLPPIQQFASISAATATGPGATMPLSAACVSLGLQVIATGAPSACVVTLEGSIDGVHFDTLATWDITAPLSSGQIVYATGKLVSIVRANSKTLTAGAAPTVSAYIAGC